MIVDDVIKHAHIVLETAVLYYKQTMNDLSSVLQFGLWTSRSCEIVSKSKGGVANPLPTKASAIGLGSFPVQHHIWGIWRGGGAPDTNWAMVCTSNGGYVDIVRQCRK